MATSRPFAYNTGSPISGTDQVGDIASGTPDIGFELTGLEWWNGPDEDLGYVICESVPPETQSTPVKMYLSPNNVGTGNTLSNNNLTVTSTGFSAVMAESRIFGKVMFSVQIDQAVYSSYIGFGKSDMNINSYVGSPDGKSVGFGSSGNVFFQGSIIHTSLPSWGTVGDVIDIAIDNSVPEFWVRVNGGDWNGNSASDPGEGGGGLSIPMSVTDIYPAITVYQAPPNEAQATLVTSPFGLPSFYNYMENYADLRFFRSTDLTEGTFVGLVNSQFGQNFSTGNQAKTYLTANGIWSNWSGFGSSGFQWMNMTTIGPTTASGIGQNNITMLVTQTGGGMATENGMYSAGTFPQEYGVPLSGSQIQNNNNGTFTAVFSTPVHDALVAFASVGNGSLSVPVIVSKPFTPIWSQSTTYQSPTNSTQYTQFTGTEGFNIIRIDGTASSISFNYTVAESYSTICFGFVDQNI